MPLLLDQVKRHISNKDLSETQAAEFSAELSPSSQNLVLVLGVFVILSCLLVVMTGIMICLCVNRRGQKRERKDHRRASSAHPPVRNFNKPDNSSSLNFLKRAFCDRHNSTGNSEVINEGYDRDSTKEFRGQSCDRSVDLQNFSVYDEGSLPTSSPAGRRKTMLNRNPRLGIPTTWFPWSDKAKDANKKSFGFLNGTLQALAVSSDKSDGILQIPADYSNTRSPSECNTVRTNCTSQGRPAYHTQQSVTSSQYRELPPVPTDESGSSSPPSSRRLFLNRSQISASPNHVTVLPECPSPTSNMESTCNDSQYDFLYGSNAALSPPPAPVMLDCRSNIDQSEEDVNDSCSISEIDPFYSTIRRKQGACVQYPQDSSVYTAASCSGKSIEHYGYCQNVLEEMRHRCGDEECQDMRCNRADISTGSSHYYSQICRPLKGDVLSSANCEYPLNTEYLTAYRRQLRNKATSIGRQESDGVRPASSGASLGLDLLKAGLAPVVVSEKDSFEEEEVSVWSQSNLAGPNLPSRAYGRSEVDLLLMLRGIGDHEASTDDLLDEALKSIWQPAGNNEADDFASPCHPMTFRKLNGLRRPSLHDLLHYNTGLSHAFVGSCTDLPINQPLMHAVTHFRQNSYSDHQLATSLTSNRGSDDSGSSNESTCQDANSYLRDPLIKDSVRHDKTVDADVENCKKEELNADHGTCNTTNNERISMLPSLGSCFRTVWSPKTLPIKGNNGELRELKLSVLPPLPPVLCNTSELETSRKPPSILYEMHTLRHMDSDIDLSVSEPLRPASPEQYHVLTPLMERSMESSCYYDMESGVNDTSLTVTNNNGFIHSRYSSGVATHSSSSGYGASCIESPSCVSLCTGDVSGARPISFTSSDVTAESGSSPPASSSSTSPLKSEQLAPHFKENSLYKQQISSQF